jgi:DNA-binding transcriptional regulator YbjK
MPPSKSTSRARKRRLDPGRRNRIIEATLKVIRENGVAGASYRRIAAEADVGLGSMTYHFKNSEELLAEALTRVGEEVSVDYARELDGVKTIVDARKAIVRIITGDIWSTSRNLILIYELYAFASRNPPMQKLVQDWMERSRAAFQVYFDPTTSRALDALIEGFSIHNSMDRSPISREDVELIVNRLTAGTEPLSQ